MFCFVVVVVATTLAVRLTLTVVVDLTSYTPDEEYAEEDDDAYKHTCREVIALDT